MQTRKFLIYPIFLLCLVFLIDSVFRIPKIQLLTKLDLTPVNYKAKAKLLEELIASKSLEIKTKKKLMVILGSSRLLYFDPKHLTAFYPEWEIYNLSSAVTTPAYYDYQLTKILDAGIKPDLIVIETDPNQFNQNGIFKISNLTYSFDLPYIMQNASIFGKENVSFFLGRKLFAVGTYKPHLDQIWRNYTNPNYATFVAMNETTYNYILDNKGHGLSPVENYIEKDTNVLDSTAHRTLDWLFSYFKFSEMQLAFYEKILSRAQREKLAIRVVWPKSSPPFEELLEKNENVTNWKNRLDGISGKYGYQIRDLRTEPAYHCNGFADGGHIAQECYASLMRVILQ